MTISGRILMLWLIFPVCAHASVLDDYVAETDPVYAWQVSARHAMDKYFTKAYTLDLTSQQWRDESELDGQQVLWRHWVNVVVPQWVSTTVLWCIRPHTA